MLFPPRHGSGSPSRVVVTGAGIVSGLGCGWEVNCEGILSGKPAFRPVSRFDVAPRRAKIAAEVDDIDALALEGDDGTGKGVPESRFERASRMLMRAAREAWCQAGWEPGDDIPVILGTTSGGMSEGEAYYRHAIESPADRRGQARRVVAYQCQRQGLDLMDAIGFRGPLTIVANACASGANAIGEAWAELRHGNADRVLTGGYDALSELVFSGFDSLQAISTSVCRPFDSNRDGLSVGEGAAVLTLERRDYARQRGAPILGEIVGYASTMDAHHLTQPHPEGYAAARAMRYACDRAGIAPDGIDYVNAHGTGTPLNDGAEMKAIAQWAGELAELIPVSSIKSTFGHTLGGAGALEAVACLMALEEQTIPPTSTLETLDSSCPFPVVSHASPKPLHTVLSNSFGFGGANASLALRAASL